MRRIFQSLLCVCLLSACDPIVDNRGFVSDNVQIDELVPGVHERADVVRVMGSPSAISQYGDPVWYYIHLRKETTAFLRPEVTEQDVTRVVFNENGTVQKVEPVENLDPVEVEYVSKETPTEGQGIGFFEQILGNIGRFGAPGARQPGSGGF